MYGTGSAGRRSADRCCECPLLRLVSSLETAGDAGPDALVLAWRIRALWSPHPVPLGLRIQSRWDVGIRLRPPRARRRGPAFSDPQPATPNAKWGTQHANRFLERARTSCGRQSQFQPLHERH
jgi:hypothetical protein